jgi:TolB protein
MNADGSELIRLTNAESESPSWSPDGRQIAFDSGSAGDSDIYAINTDGSGLTRLTEGHQYFAPLWSPDGRQVVFFSAIVGHPNVYIMNADGSGQRPLLKARDTGHMESLNWSPDSRQIAFVYGRNIYIANADGSGQKRLTGSLLTDMLLPLTFIVLLIVAVTGSVKFLLDRRRQRQGATGTS